MQPDERDAAYLWDMRVGARQVIEWTTSLDFDSFLTDLLYRSAVERNLEIIGEASRRVSRAFNEAAPQIKWRDILGQRNILAHEYGDIDYDRVWDVVSHDLPELVTQLNALIPPEPKDPD